MTRSRRLGALVAGLLVATFAAGCGDDGPTAAERAANLPAPESGFPRTIEHAMGSTTIPAKPERVVVLDTAEADAATLVGVTPVAAVSVDPVKKTYPAHLQEQLKDVPDVGPLEEPDLDKIVGLKPDLIISSKVRHEDIYKRLSDIAPTVMSDSPGKDWKDNLKMFASAMGREKEAADKLADYERRAHALGKALTVANGNQPPEISVVRFVDGPTRLYQPASFSGVVLTDMGVRRPASQQSTTELIKEIGPELIDEADADYVFVCTYGDPADTQQSDFQASPLWKELDAVKNNRVFTVSDDTWMTGIGVQGANLILADVAKAAGVEVPK